MFPGHDQIAHLESSISYIRGYPVCDDGSEKSRGSRGRWGGRGCVRGACRRQSEAAETQTWIEFSVKCGYLDVEIGRELYGTYNQILSGLVNMINHSESWLMKH